MEAVEYKQVPINYWKCCPFRGIPQMPLDSRCPSTLKAMGDIIEQDGAPDPEVPVVKRGRGRPRKDEIRVEPVVAPVDYLVIYSPVLEQDSYCFNCLNNRTREKEMGMSISIRRELPKKAKK